MAYKYMEQRRIGAPLNEKNNTHFIIYSFDSGAFMFLRTVTKK